MVNKMTYYLVKLYSNEHCINRYICKSIPNPIDLNKFIFNRINIKIIIKLNLFCPIPISVIGKRKFTTNFIHNESKCIRDDNYGKS